MKRHTSHETKTPLTEARQTGRADTNRRLAEARVKCCVCLRERTPFGWWSLPVDPSAAYSHTYCPTCCDDAIAGVENTLKRTPWLSRAAASGADQW